MDCYSQKGGPAVQETQTGRPQGFINLPDLGSKSTSQCEARQCQQMSEIRLALQISEVASKVHMRHLSGFHPKMTKMGQNGIKGQRNPPKMERKQWAYSR